MRRRTLVMLVAAFIMAVSCAEPDSAQDVDLDATISAAVESTVTARLASVSSTQSAIEPTATSAAVAFTFAELAAQAERLTYDDLFRNNEQHVGKNVYFRGRVVQVLNVAENRFQLRVNVTNDAGFWTDTVYLHYEGERLLDDDIVEFVAEVEGLQTYTAVLGNSITVPELTSTELRLVQDGQPPLFALMPTVPESSPTPTIVPLPGYSRTAPMGLGSVVQSPAGEFFIEVSVTGVIRGGVAWAMIQETNRFNDAPAPGYEYVLVEVQVTVLDAPNADASVGFGRLNASAVSESGTVYENPSLIEPDPEFDGELFVGGTLSGWLAFEVKIDDEGPLMRFSPTRNDSDLWFRLSDT